MNRKTLVIYILTALLLLAGIAAGVSFLYRNDSEERTPVSRSDALDRFPMLQAVPTDAAGILCFGSIKDGCSMLTDPTKFFAALISDGKDEACGSFFKSLAEGLEGGGLSSLRSQPLALSLHNSGSIVPLVALSVPDSYNDSTAQVLSIRRMAEEAGFKSSLFSGERLSAVLVSSSETLVNSSIRHLTAGQSVLSGKDFMHALAGVEGKDVMFFSNTYASKILSSLFQKPVTRHSEFIRNISSWTVMSISSSDDKSLEMKGFLPSEKDGDHFVNVFQGLQTETPGFIRAVPSGSFFAVSVPFADHTAYLDRYGKYLDSKARLGAHRSELSKLAKSAGTNPEDWAKALLVKEVVKAQWRSGDDICEALFVRVGRKDYSLIFNGLGIDNEHDYSMSPQPYAFSGYAAALFGSLFSVKDESSFVFTGEWLVSGSERDIADYAVRYAEGDVLQALLSDTSTMPAAMTKGCSFAGFFSAGAAPAETVFQPSVMKFLNSTMDGAAFEPCFIIGSGDSFRFEVARIPFVMKSSTPAVVADASIEIPSGPFKVMNSGTGRTNLLAQQDNYYLSLKEEDGKGIWSVPFSGPLCGAVESIDYYANGKLQFLFASGSRIYLLDRLGRFVSGFPVDLGKDILLGPAAYDFTGAKGYSVVVLHTDNTIGMYNIHGVSPEKWEGISCGETIISLPELLKVEGKNYWAVRTAVQTQIFPFYGGEPVYRQEGAKSIRRDSALEITGGNSVRVVCNDGKIRNIKL